VVAPSKLALALAVAAARFVYQRMCNAGTRYALVGLAVITCCCTDLQRPSGDLVASTNIQQARSAAQQAHRRTAEQCRSHRATCVGGRSNSCSQDLFGTVRARSAYIRTCRAPCASASPRGGRAALPAQQARAGRARQPGGYGRALNSSLGKLRCRMLYLTTSPARSKSSSRYWLLRVRLLSSWRPARRQVALCGTPATLGLHAVCAPSPWPQAQTHASRAQACSGRPQSVLAGRCARVHVRLVCATGPTGALCRRARPWQEGHLVYHEAGRAHILLDHDQPVGRQAHFQPLKVGQRVVCGTRQAPHTCVMIPWHPRGCEQRLQQLWRHQAAAAADGTDRAARSACAACGCMQSPGRGAAPSVR